MNSYNKYLQKYNKYKHKYLNIKGGSIIAEQNYNIIEKLCDKIFYLAVNNYNIDFLKIYKNEFDYKNNILYLSGIKAENIVFKNNNKPYTDSIYNVFIRNKQDNICEKCNLLDFLNCLKKCILSFCISLGWIHIFKIYLLQSEKHKSIVEKMTDTELVKHYLQQLFVYDETEDNIKFDNITIIKHTNLEEFTYVDINTFIIYFRITDNHYDKSLNFGKISLYVENIDSSRFNEILDSNSLGLIDYRESLNLKWRQIVKQNKVDVNRYTIIFTNDANPNTLFNQSLLKYVFQLALLSYEQTGICSYNKGKFSFNDDKLQITFPNIIYLEKTLYNGTIIELPIKKSILFSNILYHYIYNSRFINESLLNNTNPTKVNIKLLKDDPYSLNILQIIEYFYEMMISLKKIDDAQMFTVYSFSQYLLFNEYLLVETGQILTLNCFKSTTYNPFFESLPQFLGSDLLPMVLKIKIDPRINNLYMFIGNPSQFELVIAYGSQVQVVDIEIGYISIKTDESIVLVNCTIINCILLEHKIYQTIKDKLDLRLLEEPIKHYNKLLEKRESLKKELIKKEIKILNELEFDNTKFEKDLKSLNEELEKLDGEFKLLDTLLLTYKEDQESEKKELIEKLNEKYFLIGKIDDDKKLLLKQKELIDTIKEINEIESTLQNGGRHSINYSNDLNNDNKLKKDNKSNIKDYKYLIDLINWVDKQPGHIPFYN